MIATLMDMANTRSITFAEMWDIPIGDVMQHILITNAKADLQQAQHDRAMREAKLKRK